MTALYTAHATAVAGRDGRASTDDKKIDVKLSTPGGGGDGSNPEQLFACGYAACFGSAVAAVAKKENVDTGEVTVNSDVTLNKDDSGYSISVTLDVQLPNVDAEQAKKLVEAAHQVCPYSKATRGNINVTLKASGQPVMTLKAA